jgi:hypothetical protein
MHFSCLVVFWFNNAKNVLGSFWHVSKILYAFFMLSIIFGLTMPKMSLGHFGMSLNSNRSHVGGT